MESDFDPVSDSLSFTAGSVTGDEVCINVTLVDNDAFEKDEYFTVEVASEVNVVVHNNLTLHIMDEDGMLLEWYIQIVCCSLHAPSIKYLWYHLNSTTDSPPAASYVWLY